MNSVRKYISICLYIAVLGAAFPRSSPGQPAATATPTPAPASAEDLRARLERLEKLLAETRAELDQLKAAAAVSADARLAEIERRLDILAREIEALKLGEEGAPEAQAVQAPAATAPTPARTDQRERPLGLGLSASKVYEVKRGVSIGGYGEGFYEGFSGTDQSGRPVLEPDRVTLLRAVVYLGYKFDEHFVFNSELEYENAVVASDKNGEAEVEFAYVDYTRSRALNARAGLVLIPVGLVNELHEPVSFLGARRPDVEQVILPTTWREIGAGLYGVGGPLSWRAYVVNGLNAAGFTADEGIREGSGEGSEALAENWAFTGRLDYVGVPGLLVGASVFTGPAGQGQRTPDGRRIEAWTTVFDAHADWRWRGLWLRGLYARTSVGQANLVNELNGFVGSQSIGRVQRGWYAQAGYDLLSGNPRTRLSLIPYARYEEFDTQASVPSGYARDPANDVQQWTLGLAFDPIPQLTLKADWQRRRNAAATGVDRWNVALGWIF